MSTYKQNKFPYHLANVESNDLLYGGDEKYLNELQTIIDKLVEQILEDLAKFSENEDVNAKRIQSKLALDFFYYLLTFSELNGKSATLAVNLFSIAKKECAKNSIDSALLFLQKMDVPLANQLLKKLLEIK